MWYALAGILFGLVGGMGMGGGIVLIPALTLLLGQTQHAAQGMNLLAFLPMAIVALILHFKHGRVEKRVCFFMCLGGAAGAVLGALCATSLDGEILRRIFGGFLVLLGGYRIFTQIKNKTTLENNVSTNKHRGGK